MIKQECSPILLVILIDILVKRLVLLFNEALHSMIYETLLYCHMIYKCLILYPDVFLGSLQHRQVECRQREY